MFTQREPDLPGIMMWAMMTLHVYYDELEAIRDALMARRTLTGRQVRAVFRRAGVHPLLMGDEKPA